MCLLPDNAIIGSLCEQWHSVGGGESSKSKDIHITSAKKKKTAHDIPDTQDCLSQLYEIFHFFPIILIFHYPEISKVSDILEA